MDLRKQVCLVEQVLEGQVRCRRTEGLGALQLRVQIGFDIADFGIEHDFIFRIVRRPQGVEGGAKGDGSLAISAAEILAINGYDFS